MKPLVVGVGNPWRGDDGAGLEVARRVAELAGPDVDVRAHEGDAVRLVDDWAGARHVTVVDAADSGAPPGTLHHFDARAGPLPARTLRSSTHAFGVPDAVELARALGRLPERIDVWAIEGADYALGATLTPAVADAVEKLARALTGAEASRS